MPLKPTGFWSYSSADDAATDGRLSRIRQQLANQLQLRVGRQKVHLFQDVAAIPPGTEWVRQIEAAVAEASFFIPVITPGFVQSEWCAREVRRFRTKMEAQGRTDLILPIHYLDVDAFDAVRRGECADPELFVYLRSLQWVDFRVIETLDPDAAEARHRLGRVADAIVEALYRDVSFRPIQIQPSDQRMPTAADGNDTTHGVMPAPEPSPEYNAPCVEKLATEGTTAPLQVDQTACAGIAQPDDLVFLSAKGGVLPPEFDGRLGWSKTERGHFLVALGVLVAFLFIVVYAVQEMHGKSLVSAVK